MSTVTASMVKELRERTGLGMMQCKKALGESNGDLSKAQEYLRKQGASLAAKKAAREAREGKVLLWTGADCLAAIEVGCETDFVAASDDFNRFGQEVLGAIASQKPADISAVWQLAVGGKTVDARKNDLVLKIGEKIEIRCFAVEPLGPGQRGATYSHLGGKIGVIVVLEADGELPGDSAIDALAKDLSMQVAAANPLCLAPEDLPAEVLEKEREIYTEQVRREGKSESVAHRIVEGKLNKFYQENCLLKQVFVKDSKWTVEKLIADTAKRLGAPGLGVRVFHRFQVGS